jgi:CBS-domain-containing membrane protein
MRVGDVMTRRVRTLSQHESIDLAAAVLKFWSFRHLPVVDVNDHVVGMVTPADLLEVARDGGDLEDEPVSRVMKRPVVTAHEDESVQAALDRMVAQKVHALPVLGAGDRLVGIVADQDLLAAVSRAGPALPALGGAVVDEVMSRDPATVEPETPLADAARVLLRGGFRHLPVVDGARRLVGMLSERDLRAHLGSELAGLPHATLEALSEPVSEAMTPDPLTVRSGAPLLTLLDAFTDERVGAVPVVDEGEALLGIVSYVDLLRWLRDRVAAQERA